MAKKKDGTAKLRFRFQSSVERTDGPMRTHVIPIPDDIAEAWKAANVRRLVGTANGFEINRAMQNTADGARFLIIAQKTLKEFGLREEDAVDLDLKPDPHPDKVEIPDEFLVVLEQDAEARERWDKFKPGLRRSVVHYISDAKREDTRIRRSVEVAEKIRAGTLYGDKKG